MRVMEISLPKEGAKTEVEKFYVMPEDFKAAMVRICMRFVKNTREITVDEESPEAGEARRNKIVLTLKKRRK